MFKKKLGIFVTATIISASLLSGCGNTSSNSSTQTNQAATPSNGTDSTKTPSSTAASTTASNIATDNIMITAKNFDYDKKEIHVKKGDKVKIVLKSDEGFHGFAIPDYKVDIQGNGSTEFVADKTGTFEYHCSIMCGSGHDNMKGKLIVQ